MIYREGLSRQDWESRGTTFAGRFTEVSPWSGSEGRASVWDHKAFARCPKILRRKKTNGGWGNFCIYLKCFNTCLLLN